MILLRWLQVGTIYLMILAALAAGLAASFGRELEARRKPDVHWWVRRLLIIPFLAIASTAATDAFALRPSIAAFTAAMLSLGGYDALCLLEARWRRRLAALDNPAPAPSDSGTPS